MPIPFPDLPVIEALPRLCDVLGEQGAAVLVAPPGAGKTTAVPLRLMDETWLGDGKILVLVPRRLAARGAAARCASGLGEAVGDTIGYRVRFDARTSRRTRVEFLTEGVFARQIASDPGLEGVAAVLFDEFHERSLDSDLGLALTLESKEVLRPDLRLLVMSATLDPGPVAALLGGVPTIESAGKNYPVRTIYGDRDPRERLDKQMCSLVLRAFREHEGSLLAFLPSRADVEATRAKIAATGITAHATVLALHGGLDPADQATVLAPPVAGERRIVLATSIAESSLTIPDVRVVVDCGLARRPFYEPSSGLTRLKTVRVSQASADQRRGRAGRTGPGHCYRMWLEAQTGALQERDRPEILDADLAPLILLLTDLGIGSIDSLKWLDPPPQGARTEATTLLQMLGLFDQDGRLTELGQRAANMPLHPRLAILVRGANDGTYAAGAEPLAAELAALIAEPGLGGDDVDLIDRLGWFRRNTTKRAQAARKQAQKWINARLDDKGLIDVALVGTLIARAYPDRIAQRRGGDGRFLMANGRGVVVDAASPLSRADMIVAVEVAGGGTDGHVRLAVRLDPDDLVALWPSRLVTETRVRVDAERGAVVAEEVQRFAALVLKSRRISPVPADAQAALCAHLEAVGLHRLPWTAATISLRTRLAFLRDRLGAPWPTMDDESLQETVTEWLGPYLAGLTRLADLSAPDLENALLSHVPPELQSKVSDFAPAKYLAPSGQSHGIDYAAEAGPTVRVKVQEFYGLSAHPMVLNGQVPLVLELLSPARRPIQTTTDIVGFWAGSWADVRREMRGRYPKHNWSNEPQNAVASQRTTKSRDGGG